MRNSLALLALCLIVINYPAKADCPAAPLASTDDMVVSFVAGQGGTQAAPSTQFASTIKEGMLVYDDTANALKICNGTNWQTLSVGGSGVTAAGTVAGAVQFRSAGGNLAADDTNFVWDDTNNRLGVGTASPSSSLHVSGGALRFSSWDASQVNIWWPSGGALRTGSSGSNVYLDVGNLYVRDGNASSSNAVLDVSGRIAAGVIGVGTSTPNTSALLDVSSTTKGFLPPRMTTAQVTAVASPADGLIVYDTDTDTIKLRANGAWISLLGGSGSESDPQVGTLTATKWCAANAGGTAIDCTADAPATGAAGAGSEVQFRNSSTGAFAAEAALRWDAGGKYIMTEDSDWSGMVQRVFSDASGVGPAGSLVFSRGRGTAGAPTPPLANNMLGLIAFRSYEETGGAEIRGYSAEDQGTGLRGGYLTFLTTPVGTAVGAERMRIIANGNVGIGTTAPAHKLEISGGLGIGPVPFSADPDYYDSDAYISFRDGESGFSEDFIGYRDNTFYLKDAPGGGDSTEPSLVVFGNLGVGAATPQSKLDVAGGARVGADSVCNDAKAGTLAFNGGTLQVCISTAMGFSNLAGTGGSTSQWTTAGSDIYYTGNVGIGTTTPGLETIAGRTYLTVKGPTDAGVLEFASGVPDADQSHAGLIQFVDVNSTGTSKRIAAISGSLDGVTANNRGGSIRFFTRADNTGTNVTEKMRISGSGNVGIGTIAPDVPLAVDGANAAWQAYFGDTATAARAAIWSGEVLSVKRAIFGTPDASTAVALNTAGNDRLWIRPTGEVGIGTTTPDSILDVGGTSNTAFIQNLAAWGLNARTQGLIIMPEGTVTDDGLGNLTIPTSIVMNPLSGSWVRITAGTYSLGAWGSLWVPIPPTGARGTTVTPTVLAWADADRNYDGRDRLLLAQRNGGGHIWTRFGISANLSSAISVSGGSSQWTTTGSDIYYSAGKVGIGTATPKETLEVVGRTYINPNNLNDGTNSNALSVVRSGTNDGIRYTQAGIGAIWMGHSAVGILGTDVAALTFKTGINSSGAIGTTGTERMRIDANGNVGIGTSSPLGQLTLGGAYNSIQMGSSAAASDNFHWVNEANYSNRGLSLYSGNLGAGTHLLRMLSTGSVGIGTGSPGYKLHVNGSGGFEYNVNISTTGASQCCTQESFTLSLAEATRNGSGTIIGPRASIQFHNGSEAEGFIRLAAGTTSYPKLSNGSAAPGVSTTNNSRRFIFGGYQIAVGIESTGPVYGNGNVWTPNLCRLDGSSCTDPYYLNYFYTNYVSDERTKTNVKSLTDTEGLDTVLKLRPVRFDWRDKIATKNVGPQIGLIAQDVEKVIPEAIDTLPDRVIETADGRKETIKSPKAVAYDRLVAPLIKAVQELKALFDVHDEQIRALQAENQELRKLLGILHKDVEALKGH